MRRRVAACTLALLCGVGGLSACGEETFDVEEASDAPADYSYLIPSGSGAAIDAGEPLDILPGRLDAEIGEVLEIINEDDRGHVIGPFFAGAGETVRIEFTTAGEYRGGCTVHPSGEIVVVVS